MTAALASSDFLRAPVLGIAQPAGFKEWHHFVVHGARSPAPDQLQPHQRDLRPVKSGWRRASSSSPTISGGQAPSSGSTIPNSTCRPTSVVSHRRQPNGHAARRLPGGDRPARTDIQGELQFTSVSRPFVVNNQPVGEGRMCWLFVPKLRADGWLRIGGQEHRMNGELGLSRSQLGAVLVGR